MNPQDKALEVAIDVAQRRRNGVQISDSVIINAHPELQPFLEVELKKLQVLTFAQNQLDVGDDEEGEEQDIRVTVVAGEQSAYDMTQFIESPVATASVDTSQHIAHTKAFRPVSRPSTGLLKIMHDDQRYFEPRLLMLESTMIGRRDADIVIPHDGAISSRHATIERRKEQEKWRWYLADAGSTNGTFVRVDGTILRNDDEIIMGSERYLFSEDGQTARLNHLDGEEVVNSIVLNPEGTWLGRDYAELMESFWDELLDPKHAFIHLDRKGKWHMQNPHSVNGVWKRIQEVRLTANCVFQIGEQRICFSYLPQAK